MSISALPALSAALDRSETRATGAAPSPSARLAPVDAEAPAPEVGRAQLIAAAAQANRGLQQKSMELAIEFDDELDRSIFRLVDSVTGELVRQVPSEEMLAMARALAAGASAGALLKTYA